MFKTLANLSLRYKLLCAFGAVLVVMVIQGINSINSLSSVHEQVDKVVGYAQPAVISSMEIAAEMQQTAASLGFYLLSKEKQHKDYYIEGQKALQALISQLQTLPAISNSPQGTELVRLIARDVSDFEAYRDQMILLAENPNENIPAMQLAGQSINPVYREMIQLIGTMILSEETEEPDEERKEMLAAMNSLRFTLVNLNNEIRLYLAFRTSAALDNLSIYSETLQSQAEGLAAMEALFTLEQADAYAQLMEKIPPFLENTTRLIELHSSDQWRSDAFVIRSELTPLVNRINDNIQKLIAQERETIDSAQRAATKIYSEKRLQFLIVGLIVAIGIAAFALLLAQRIVKPLRQAVRFAHKISQGELNNQIQKTSQDETGDLIHALCTMQTDLRKRIEDDQKSVAENLRIRYALDHVSTCVTVSNDQNQLIYMNLAAQDLISVICNALQDQKPGLSPDKLLGDSLTNLFTDKKLIESYRALLDQQSIFHTDLAGLRLTLIANPVYDEQGSYKGRVTQWVDRTAQLAVEEEIDNLVEAASNGDLAKRIELNGKEGFLLQLGTGFNRLLDILSNVFENLAETLSQIANGDLTHSVQNDYRGAFGRVKEDVNKTRSILERVIKELYESTEMLSTSASEINGGNTRLSNRTDKQASSLEQTASKMEQLTSIIRNNAENAQQAAHLSNSAQNSADEGGSVVQNAMHAMEEIIDASNRISEIISVIDEIAFQTNLLALNASVEAARAGDQGRGFAVVATEVRNLATRSATAANEIKQLIQDSLDKVQAGSELVNHSGRTLDKIVDEVVQVGEIITEIASASQQQALGIEQINRTISQMDQMTQQNAALAEETSSASKDMHTRTREIRERLAFFKIARQ